VYLFDVTMEHVSTQHTVHDVFNIIVNAPLTECPYYWLLTPYKCWTSEII